MNRVTKFLIVISPFLLLLVACAPFGHPEPGDHSCASVGLVLLLFALGAVRK
jgi:hypothetical protein